MPKFRALLASLILAAPLAAHSVPTTYDLTFNGGGLTSGSFVFDAEIARLQDFVLRFDDVFGAPLEVRAFGFDDAFLFEVLTGESAGQGCTLEDVSCATSVALDGLELEVGFSRASAVPLAQYQILDLNGLVHSGNVIAQRRVTVVEPEAMTLFSVGLLALAAFARRRHLPLLSSISMRTR